jgi:hypothetical protein
MLWSLRLQMFRRMCCICWHQSCADIFWHACVLYLRSNVYVLFGLLKAWEYDFSETWNLRYPDTSLNCRTGIAIRIRYGDTPIRHRYGIGEVSRKKKNRINLDTSQSASDTYLESIGACVRDCRARDARGAEGEASPMPCENAVSHCSTSNIYILLFFIYACRIGVSLFLENAVSQYRRIGIGVSISRIGAT